MKRLINPSTGSILTVLLAAVLSACSPSTDEPSLKAKVAAESPKPSMPKKVNAVPPTPAPVAKTITIQIHNPEPAHSEEDKIRLKQEVEALERPLKEVIEEYDRNLDNPEQKHRLELKMQAGVDAYNQKVLSLVKEELKQNPVPAQ
jgi:hypothetical protein